MQITVEELMRQHNEESERLEALANEKGVDLNTREGQEVIRECVTGFIDARVVAQFILTSMPLSMAVQDADFLTLARAFFRAGYLAAKNEVRSDA
jgi:hypothetical protein